MFSPECGGNAMPTKKPKRQALSIRLYQDEALQEVEELELPPMKTHCRHAWHLYILRLNLQRLKIDRAEFIRELRQKGIGASVHFIPIPLLRYFSKLPLGQYACPRALELYPRIVSLPLYPGMTEDQVQYVARCVREVVESSRRARLVATGTKIAALPVGALDATGS
jgi:dTDP-4-amino-4,6-dideoxygalactose transaminase